MFITSTKDQTCSSSCKKTVMIGCICVLFVASVDAVGYRDRQEIVGIDRLLLLTKSSSSALAVIRNNLEWMKACGSSCLNVREFAVGSYCARLKGGGEALKSSKSTPKVDRSAKKRRHRSAFYHSDRGSEEDLESVTHSERTFR